MPYSHLPHLFRPLNVGGLTLPNRVAVSPMCMYSAQNGLANDFHLVHLGQFALGRAGLIIAEVTAVSPEGRISAADLGLWDDAQIGPLGRVTDFVHAHGSLVGVQLAHAGRKASTVAPGLGHGKLDAEHGGWGVIGPSELPYSDRYHVPQAMTPEDIGRVTADFAAAARRAEIAGFDLVEIHAAHGYLLHEFLSPVSNTRSDEYGGSFENRVRFLLEVVRAVRRVWPNHRPLAVRLSVTDWIEGGWDESQSVELARLLGREGVDIIDVSSGGLSPEQQAEAGPAWHAPFAAQIKQAVPDMQVMVVGFIDLPERAEEVLAGGGADLIAIGRPFLSDPHWVEAAALRLGAEVERPVQYRRGTRTT